MMKRILIAPLGTGAYQDSSKPRYEREYKTVKYSLEGKIYETPFVSEALMKHYKVDKIILIGTMGSMWDTLYQYYAEQKQEFNEDVYFELCDRVDSSNHTTPLTMDWQQSIKKVMPVECDIILTPYGINEVELMQNFTTIFSIAETLEKDCSIILDITHGFRSQAMYNFLIASYISDLRPDVKIEHITYGMLELLKELKECPIVDLNVMMRLMKFIKGAYELKEYGNGFLLADLLNDELRTVTHSEVQKKLVNFTKTVNLGYMLQIKEVIEQIKGIEKSINQLEGFYKTMLPNVLGDFVKRFKKANREWQYQFEMAKWFEEQKRYGQAYIALGEAIVTYYCEKEGEDPTLKEARETAKNRMKNREYGVEIYNLSKNINTKRNNIAHAVLENGRNRSNVLSDWESLPRDIKTLERLLK